MHIIVQLTTSLFVPLIVLAARLLFVNNGYELIWLGVFSWHSIPLLWSWFPLPKEIFLQPFTMQVYPEKHMEAPNFDTDLKYLKQKIDNGAEYMVTQMFFDNSKFFAFVDKCRAIGIDVPIIPGLKPLATLSQLNLLPQRFKVDLPDDLVAEVLKAKDNAAIREIGIEWCAQQSRELIEAGTPIVHYYSMGKSENIRRIILKCTS